MSTALADLIASGDIVRDKNGKYLSATRAGAMRGTVQGSDRGFAIFLPEDKSLPDLFIPARSLGNAMHGDTVLVERVYGRSDDEAEVVCILSRGYTEIVGTFQRDKRAGYLIPDEKKFCSEIYIPLSQCLF